MANPLVVPSWSTPIVEKLQYLFSRQWYLFFEGVARAIKSIPRVFYGTLDPDQKPTGLGPNDAGVTFVATDYKHTFLWTGSAWEFIASDPGSEFVVAGSPATGAPKGGLWGLCDGSAYDCAQPDGTLVSRTSQDLTGNVFLLGASGPGTQQVATRATWEAGAKTADTTSVFDSGAVTEIEDAHTHDVSVAGDTFTKVAGGDSFALPGTYSTITNSGHSHDITNAGAPQLAHSHNLTDALSQLKKFSESDGGLPLRIGLGWYLRR